MRHIYLLSLVIFTWSIPAGSGLTDEIILKNRKVFSTVKSESGLGITVTDGKKTEFIAAGDIVDIRYDKKGGDPSNEYYRPTREKEATLEKAKNRQNQMLEAVQLYEKALERIPNDADQDLARRNVEFRIAYLRGRLAVEYRVSPTLALAALKAFKEKHRNSWQITPCLHKLAELQILEKRYADAEKTYSELSLAPVAEEVKQEANLLAARLGMQNGNYAQVQTKLQELLVKLPKNSPVALRASVTLAECLALAKKADESNKLLRQLLKESSDKNLKALAHNALGKNLFDQGQFKEARWEFLWVEVVFNQDKAEHAKSLYYLWQTFGKLGETQRAQECLEILLSEQFAGMEYQSKARTESKQ